MSRINKTLLAVIAISFVSLLSQPLPVQAGEQVDLGGYRIELISYAVDGDQSTWTYAITLSSPDQRPQSRWTLEVDACYELNAPQPGSYVTPVDVPACADGTLQCESMTYQVLFGDDPVTGLHGITFAVDEMPAGVGENAGPISHVFEITVSQPDMHFADDVRVAVISEGRPLVDYVTGPACVGGPAGSGVPSAVQLASFIAVSPRAKTTFPAWHGAVLITLIAGAIAVRRR